VFDQGEPISRSWFSYASNHLSRFVNPLSPLKPARFSRKSLRDFFFPRNCASRRKTKIRLLSEMYMFDPLRLPLSVGFFLFPPSHQAFPLPRLKQGLQATRRAISFRSPPSSPVGVSFYDGRSTLRVLPPQSGPFHPDSRFQPQVRRFFNNTQDAFFISFQGPPVSPSDPFPLFAAFPSSFLPVSFRIARATIVANSFPPLHPTFSCFFCGLALLSAQLPIFQSNASAPCVL